MRQKFLRNSMLIKVRRVSDGVGDGEGVIMSISVVVATVERFVQHRTGRHVKDFDSWTFENPACQSLLTAPAFQDVTKLATIGRGQTDFGKLEKIVQILFRNRVTAAPLPMTGEMRADCGRPGDLMSSASAFWHGDNDDALLRNRFMTWCVRSMQSLRAKPPLIIWIWRSAVNRPFRPCGGNERENVNGRHAVGRWLAK